MTEDAAALAGRLQALLDQIKALPHWTTRDLDDTGGPCSYESVKFDHVLKLVRAALQEAPHAPLLRAIHGEHHAATFEECGHWRCQDKGRDAPHAHPAPTTDKPDD